MSVIMAVALAASGALADPAQEARAQSLDAEIRCVVCQNEPIAQSTADVAADMRTLVRERIAAGDSDEQIRTFFRERYGDFVLFRPPFDPRTWLLWATPALPNGSLSRRRREVTNRAATAHGTLFPNARSPVVPERLPRERRDGNESLPNSFAWRALFQCPEDRRRSGPMSLGTSRDRTFFRFSLGDQ